MPHLTDNIQGTEEDNHKDLEGREIDEVNGNCKSSTQNPPLVENPSNEVISNAELMDSVGVSVKKKKDNELISGESNDGGDMDIGLDLSLNETGVLEAESSDITQSHNALESKLCTQDAQVLSTKESSVSGEIQTSSTALPSTEQTGPSTEQTGPSTEQTGPSTEQTGPSTEQTGPSTEQTGPSTEQTGPSTEETGPSTEETGPSTEETGPSTEETGPSTEQTELPAEEETDKLKTSGKRVTFPSDEDIVSGAVEPKDPWRHAQNVTVEEILSSYKVACQKLTCKPLPKVLKQIQELKEFTQRNECLDLKGEKLDYKSCESLEEILKRVQFKVIDLEQTNLDEDGASALFDMIEYYESATHLNISFNKHIGTRGWQAAAHMMRKTSSLQYLDARNTPLLDHSAPFVARALRISGSLAVLHLENAGLSGRPLMLLATALKMNMNLRELYLADNKLNGLQDSAQLGNLLKFNYNIQILDLRNNHILDSGLAYICEGLKEQRKGLVTLVLWNNQLTHNGMGYLAAALPCTQSLETLNLGHNSVGNEGVHKLKDGLIGNRSVLRLGLASTKLSCEGAVAVAEFIAESPRLLRLDLRENEIKTGGLMALSLALKVNTSLLRLDLDREPKKETVKSFIETQRALLSEIQNGCKRNFILAKEKEENEQKMRQSASMAEIATEDGTGVEEEEAQRSEDQDQGPKKDEEKIESEPEAGSESEKNPVKEEPLKAVDSDSDTEDEEEVVSSVSAALPAPSVNLVPHPPLPPPPPPPPTTDVGQSIHSNITVTEAAAPAVTPPSPGRCISVSSPGRGHKIFLVTRVESPPEQQQVQPFSKRENLSKTPANTDTTPNVESARTSALYAEQGPVATPKAPQTSTLTSESVSHSTEDTTRSTLNTTHLQESTQGADTPAEHTKTLTKDTTESTKEKQSEAACVEQLDRDTCEQQQPLAQTVLDKEQEMSDDGQLRTVQELCAKVALENLETPQVELETVQCNEEQAPATEMQESKPQPEEADDGSGESSADECFSEALTGEEGDVSAVLPNACQLCHGARECQLWARVGRAAARSQFRHREGCAMSFKGLQG
uniref:Protein phosphatase 1 regulatory subunit 37 n=1 Tax=Knipowitschia caucasica TaxID=637954 RepID=A0AAV2J3U8_KNICA